MSYWSKRFLQKINNSCGYFISNFKKASFSKTDQILLLETFSCSAFNMRNKSTATLSRSIPHFRRNNLQRQLSQKFYTKTTKTFFSTSANHRNNNNNNNNLHPETTSLHSGYDPLSTRYKSIKPPLYLSSTFVFDNAETGADAFAQVYGLNGKQAGYNTPYIYSRVNNPNMYIFEERLSKWDKMKHNLLFSSGMSAISTLFHTVLKPGDHIIISDPVYGGTHALSEHILPQYGIHAHFINAGNNACNEIDTIIKHDIKYENLCKLKLIFIETPSNPNITHTNIKELSNITKSINKDQQYWKVKNSLFNNDANECDLTEDPYKINKECLPNCLLAVDNTFLGPVFQTPSIHGADIVVYSATKFLGGHSDLIAGAISCNDEELYNQLLLYRTLMGSMSQPFISWLLLRSLETLSIRMNKSNENCIKLSKILQNHKYVTNIKYPLLENNNNDTIENSKQWDTYNEQCTNPGSIITFDIIGTKKDAYKVLDNLNVIKLAVSLGGTESLIEHPQSMTHSDCNPKILNKQGINDTTLRISVGIEHIDDLKNDLQQALDTLDENSSNNNNNDE